MTLLRSFLLKIPSYAQHAPGIPKVLVGNRLHLAFRRQVSPAEAEEYAEKNAMGFFEVSSFKTARLWALFLYFPEFLGIASCQLQHKRELCRTSADGIDAERDGKALEI